MPNPYEMLELETASPVLLVAKLYEGAIRAIRTAIRHDEAGDMGERGDALAKALAILAELRRSLDVERGGEVAQNLDLIYEFATARILEANLGRGDQPLEAAVRVLEPVHAAWGELARRPEGAAAAEPPAAEAAE